MSATKDEIEAVLENGTISKWERDFLEDMKDRLERSLTLSEGQQDRVDKIIEENS